jgi:predicted Zn-dependent protease
VHGDNPEEGIVRGDTFLHPELRFALQFPEGWDIRNSKTQVVAQEPNNEIYMLLQLVEQPRGRTMEEVAVRAMRDAGFRQAEGGETTINGLEAYVGTYQGRMGGVGQVVMRAAHIAYGRTVYVFAGMAGPADYARVERLFTGSIRSFRPLSRSEAADVRPNRIDLYRVRAGDTWQSIAQRASEGNVKPATLAIMNNYPANEQPRAGDQIKIVVAG